MMYSEFVLGTGCKENDHNYEVYKNLEIMYMNSDMTKEQIYEYGKKLVDNSKSEAEIQIEAQIKAEMDVHKSEIERYKKLLANEQDNLNWWKNEDDKEMISYCKRSVDYYKGEIKYLRTKVAELKWILG